MYKIGTKGITLNLMKMTLLFQQMKVKKKEGNRRDLSKVSPCELSTQWSLSAKEKNHLKQINMNA